MQRSNFFMNCFEFINNLRNISGKNDKIKFLKDNQTDVIKKMLVYTYDPAKTFGLTSKSVDYAIGDEYAQDETMKNWFSILDKLISRNVTGNAAREMVYDFVSNYIEADEMVKMLDKSLDIGMSESSINTALPKIITVFKVTLAKKYKWNGKLPFPVTCISQKFDGVRCVIIRRGKDVKFYSRTGKRYMTLDNMLPDILSIPYDNFVMDGEIIKGDGTGKYFQSLMKEVRKKNHLMKNFTYQVFDIMPYNDFYGVTASPYLDRQYLYKFDDTKYIKSVPQVRVNRYEELEVMWELAMDKGWEGIMLRNGYSPYEAKRSSNLLKMKVMQDAEFKVVNFQEGDGKLKGRLGAMGIDVDGKIVLVGSGFSDELRKEIWNNQHIYIDKQATIQFFEKTDDGSLRFPVFKAFR